MLPKIGDVATVQKKKWLVFNVRTNRDGLSSILVFDGNSKFGYDLLGYREDVSFVYRYKSARRAK